MFIHIYATVLHFHSKRTAQIPAVLNIPIRCEACLRVEGNHYEHLLEFSVGCTTLHGVILHSMNGFRFIMDILYNTDII